MSIDPALESLAMRELNEAWRDEAGPPPFVSPWLLHDLLELLHHAHDQPVAKLTDQIRGHVIAQNYATECGDQADTLEAREAQIDRQVRVLVVVLERVREAAQRKGVWSPLAAAPPMFG